MTRATHPRRGEAVTPPPTLAGLSEIAAALSSGEPHEATIGRILDTVRRVLGAAACTVWLQTPHGLIRSWHAGDAAEDPKQIAAVIEAGAGGKRLGDDTPPVSRLADGGRTLGAMAVHLERALTEEEKIFVATVSNLVGPVLAHAERSRQLEVEVQLRTREIEEQRRFTERIIDSLPVGLYVIDRGYRIQAWNRKRETGMQGVSREEAIGRTIFEILHRQPAELLRDEFDDVFATGRIQQFQIDSESTGETRTYRISKIPMRIDDADVTHVITIGEDITDWRAAQERFAQSEKLAAIGTLAAGVMHEINNPLATIAACAESLVLRLEDLGAGGVPVPPECQDYLRIVDQEVHRCKRIVDGLLDFSRPKPVTKTELDLNAVIEQTLFLLKHHSRFKKLTVQTELEPAAATGAYGNPEQLIQVFMALLLNAVDAMGEQGSIALRTRVARTPEPAVVAEVIDRGHGIRRNAMHKIFEPFYTTKPPGRGTGLGLSICYGIIADHGGRIEVDSVAGQGSTFRIILPVSAGQAGAPA